MPTNGPSVIVLGGVNGAGKTTSSRALLAGTLNVRTFVNADVLAQGLAGFDPDSAAVEAGRVMLARLRALAEQRADFAFETTLAGRSYAGWLRSLRDTGHVVHLVYFWLNSADLAVARVAQRVREGGHNVPEAAIRQRYQRSVRNFFDLYRPVVSSWRAYDNSVMGSTPRPIAFSEAIGQETVLEEALWEQMRTGAAN
jgi:predicted ABC-type ATPase